MEHRLTLAEQFLLLGWDDRRGRNRYTQNLPMLLAGAAILELTLDGHLTMTDKGVVAATSRTGIDHLDLVLGKVTDSRRTRSVKSWVHRIGNRSELKKRTLSDLTLKGILRDRQQRVLGLFPMTTHPLVDEATAETVRASASGALTDSEPLTDARQTALAGLVHPAGGRLLRRLVPKQSLRAARSRAKALSKGEGMSSEIADAIGEANMATMAAIAAATTAATSSSSSSSSGS